MDKSDRAYDTHSADQRENSAELLNRLPKCMQPQLSAREIVEEMMSSEAPDNGYARIDAVSCAPGRKDFIIYMPKDMI